MIIEKGTVFINENAWNNLALMVKKINPSSIFVIVDENIESHCLPHFAKQFNPMAIYETIRIPLGEKNKNIYTCLFVWESLSRKGADRSSLIINLGGGVITDLGGFAASTYKRGIPFINVPTSLLAMVDASVGGKTGIDLNHVKNQIGTIQLPEMVVIDSEFLQTLPRKQLLSGMAEMIKHSLIESEKSWEELHDIDPFDILSQPELIWESIQIKQKIVQEDPMEKGRRKILNFGHTLGHAIESHFLSCPNRFPLLHGEAIAIGMILASHLSSQIYDFSPEKLSGITSYILSLFPKQNFTEKDIKNIFKLMLFDKKNQNGRVLFVLMEDFGKFKIDCVVDNDLIINAFSFYREF